MLNRLETMVLMGARLPLEAVRSQIASALDILVHLGRLGDGSRKVLSIVEVRGISMGEIETEELYRYDRETGRLEKDVYKRQVQRRESNASGEMAGRRASSQEGVRFPSIPHSPP